MTWENPLEDERGVDVGQIRRQLALTPAQRVDWLIDTIRVYTDLRRAVTQGHERL